MPAVETKVIIADDHPLFRVALRLILHRVSASTIVVEADSFDALKHAAAANPTADLALLDLLMPGVEGLSALQFLRSDYPQLRVCVISARSPGSWLRPVRALGAVGFIHKTVTPEHLEGALHSLLIGNDWWMPVPSVPAGARGWRLARLSEQEIRVLSYLREGCLNRQIAAALNVSESTIKADVRVILRKLDVSSRTQAAVLAQRLLSGAEPPDHY